MKKIFLFLLTTIISISSFAQNLPQGIAYQAVAVKESPYSVAGENPSAIYWSNKDIKVRFTILDQYPNPTDTYQEFHSVTTDDYGVFNLIIGRGTVISGDFETIPWELGTAHLQVEIDFDNDNNYVVTSFERFWSVPYAKYSQSSEETDPIFNASVAKGITSTDTAYWNRIQDRDSTNELQQISISNDTLFLSNGGGKVALISAWSTVGDTTSTFNQVGIGTNNPTHSLEVVGSGYGDAWALKLKRNRNIPTYGVRLDFNLLNSKNEDIKYGSIIGSIADSTAGAEKGFLSLGVANGSGTWSNGYTEERLRIETDRVTVKNLMRLKPLSAAPASPLEGDIYMNSVLHKLMVYDGTKWQACW